MSPELRACVHEYGYAIVYTCRKWGVTKPSAIHELVREIWEGARQGSNGSGGLGTLDWLLVQAGAKINAVQLARVFRNNNLLIVPTSPTTEMINASMNSVNTYTEKVTKAEKHRRRLIAALNAGVAYFDRDLRWKLQDEQRERV